MGNQRGLLSCMIRTAREPLVCLELSFIIVCSFLEKLIRTAVKEPDCLSNPPLPPPVLQFNFVGKLLGPRGNSMKRLQEETGAKMSILGKGSMRDKDKV